MEYTGRPLIVVRGAGDISTGTIHRLFRAGFPVAALEVEKPSAIRREVAFSEAVYDKTAVVEGVEAVLIHDPEEVAGTLASGKVPLLMDPGGESIRVLKPFAVVDAILAKKNLGTSMDMAELTIALGPGFEAGKDVQYVIETMRGHDLGRIISKGSALPNTGVPGKIGGYAAERVIHAGCAGIFRAAHEIGDVVEAGEAIGWIESAKTIVQQEETGTCRVPVKTVLTGILRGIIRDGYPVTKGFKIADVDPRKEEQKNCFTISDKARCIAGSVLEIVTAATLQKQAL